MIDKALAALALIQTFLTTLRAGSRALHIFRTGCIGVMEGPPILPPRHVNESATLWELSTSFRHAVILEARPDMYETEYVETMLMEEESINEQEQGEGQEHSPGRRTVDVYRLSTFGAIPEQFEIEDLDRRIEEILLEEKEEEEERQVHKQEEYTRNGNGAEKPENQPFQSDLQDNLTASKDDAPFSSPEDGLVQEAVLDLECDGMRDVTIGTTQTTGIGLFFRKNLSRLTKFLALGRSRNLYETDQEDVMDEEIMSATSFRTCVEIGAEFTTPKKVSLLAYTPELFRDLRTSFGITEGQYLHSILETGPFVSFQSNSKGAARVGGSFFFTKDGAYLIKSIKKDEVGAFLHMLPKYFNFMKQNGRRSLLTRFCGMYEIDLPSSSKKTRRETFVVMNAVFPAEASKFVAERFDLKGSTMGRQCSLEERISKGSNAVLKDLDLAREVALLRSLRRNRGPKDVAVGLHVGPTAKSAILVQLRRDVQLLVDCNLIDYSLLVGTVLQKTNGPTIQDIVISSFSDGIDQRLHMTKRERAFPHILLGPIRFLLAPPIMLYNIIINSIHHAATSPFPYYGSELCGVEAGSLTHVQGERLGRKAVYYFGVIDFLQPFNWKKKMEWRWKAYRYGQGFSCVPPEEYAERFLDFVEKHLT